MQICGEWQNAGGPGAAGAQGMMFSRNVFGDQADARPAYDNVASAVFTSPQIATCGLTEEEAVAQHGDLSIFTSTYRRARCSTPSGPTTHFWAHARLQRGCNRTCPRMRSSLMAAAFSVAP